MANTRFKGGTASERITYTDISDADMIQLRHKPGTEDDVDKGISKASLQSCPFGVSDTLASTAAKTASLTDSNPDFSLVSGREVVVCFTTVNSANTPTLNFAGSGAYPLYYPDGSAVGSWSAGTWMHLKYFSATVGGNLLQRWIVLSPGKVVDSVASGNMNSVTSNAVAASGSFTTSEVNTGLTWIDGKPIYKKVIQLPFTAGVPVSATIPCVKLSDFQVIDMGHSYIYAATYGTRQPWGANGNSDVGVFYISGGTLKFTSSHPDGTFFAVVLYTKSA